MTPNQQGKRAEREFLTRYETFGKDAYVVRLQDASDIKGRSRSAAQVNVPPVPADFIVISWHGMHFAEVKATVKDRFAFDMIAPTQLGHAARAVRASPLSYFFYVLNITAGTWYKVPAEVVLQSEKKSLAWSEISSFRWGL